MAFGDAEYDPTPGLDLLNEAIYRAIILKPYLKRYEKKLPQRRIS